MPRRNQFSERLRRWTDWATRDSSQKARYRRVSVRRTNKIFLTACRVHQLSRRSRWTVRVPLRYAPRSHERCRGVVTRAARCDLSPRRAVAASGRSAHDAATQQRQRAQTVACYMQAPAFVLIARLTPLAGPQRRRACLCMRVSSGPLSAVFHALSLRSACCWHYPLAVELCSTVQRAVCRPLARSWTPAARATNAE